ncbi:DNA/RNA helicase domain-containing protein [Streptosporangium sp. NPDC049376]|uniref:DNA/RNA helicase domain-containing protein n=1 Tax=Streptosporangium sp. NPDC049376 TaxID=3366192 RepID=UPI0037A757E1
MSNHSSAAVRRSARDLAALTSKDGSAVSKLIAAELSAPQNTGPSSAETESLQSGLAILSRDLIEAGLGDVEMLVEFKLPLTSKRADVILAGIDPRTGEDAYVIVELKQWSQAELYEGDPNLVVASTENDQPKLHPVVQVLGYCDYLSDFISTLEHHHERVSGVVYLYEAGDENIKDLYGHAQDERARLFSRTRRDAFLDYLQERFAPLPGIGAADRLLSSAVRPSKQLIKIATEEIRHREQLVLLAEQRLPYEIVLNAVDRARTANSKEVVIITGGPGSGKSAIALSLLGELSRRGHRVMHATGSRSFTETLRRVPGRGSSKVKNLFRYFNSFMQADPDGLDVLICDEAHRIRETSQNRYTPARLRSDRLQIDELIDAARVPVFFLDEHQVIRPGEMGTTAAIRGRAAARGFRVHEVSLDEQFRYGGSRAYDEWVLRLLGLHDDPPEPWMGDDHFDVSLAASPHELEALLRVKHDQGYSARVTAGFCWPWSDPREDDTLVRDVRIGDWSRPWTVKGDRAVGEAPASALWATQEGGFGQVGSVYAAQGFEYDWNGVIIGPDLVYRDGRLVTMRSASKDPALTRGTTAEQADRFVRNTYKVLLTRGLTGTVLYSTDSETQGFLAKLLPPASG